MYLYSSRRILNLVLRPDVNERNEVIFMKVQILLAPATVALFGIGMLIPGVATAHNAGHVDLPNGGCVNVGAGNEVLLPETAQAPQNSGHLDLIPGPGDQFGSRYAAVQGDSRVDPAHSEGCLLTGNRAF